MEREETLRLEAYLKEKLNPGIRLLAGKDADKPTEVYVGAEFIATIYKDVDEGEVSYQLNMTVLEEDITGE